MTTVALTVTGCGQDAPKGRGAAETPPPSQIRLNGSGFAGARIDDPALKTQKTAVAVLGKPDRVAFSGCELGGPAAVFNERSWTWGALTLYFTNEAKTRRVVPGQFSGWSVSERGGLPDRVQLPYGVSIGASPEAVRGTLAVKSAGPGLPGVYEIESLDGVRFIFADPYRRLSALAVNTSACE